MMNRKPPLTASLLALLSPSVIPPAPRQKLQGLPKSKKMHRVHKAVPRTRLIPIGQMRMSGRESQVK